MSNFPGVMIAAVFGCLLLCSMCYGFNGSPRLPLIRRKVISMIISPDAKTTPHLVEKDQPLSNEELSDLNLLKIVDLSASDEDCNVLVWKCLGYKYDSTEDKWLNDDVFPKWKSKYPEPVDVIGVTRIYDPKVDLPVRTASIDLMRAIPRDFKGGIRTLQSVGFEGYKYGELTPNITRRAQLCNFVLYYRAKLHGKTLDQLKAEREVSHIHFNNSVRSLMLSPSSSPRCRPHTPPLSSQPPG